MRPSVVYLAILCIFAGLVQGSTVALRQAPSILSATAFSRTLQASNAVSGIYSTEDNFYGNEELYIQREKGMQSENSNGRKRVVTEKKLNRVVLAIQKDDSVRVRRFLSHGVSVDASYADTHSDSTPVPPHSTLLHWAAYYNAYKSARVLVRAGAFLESRNAESRTPLHVAAEFGSQETAKVLLQAGARVDVLDYRLKTPLFLAVDEGRMDMISILVQFGDVDINSPNSLGETPLHVAVSRGKLDLVKALHKSGADVDTYDKAGYTPIHEAACLGRYAIVKYLLSCGANVDFADFKQGWTPLLEAANHGFLLIATALAEHHADLNAGDFTGWSPLHAATRYKRIAIVKMLLNHGANPNVANLDKWTALHEASYVGSLEIAQALVKAGASPKKKCTGGKYPVDVVCSDEDRSNCSQKTKAALVALLAF